MLTRPHPFACCSPSSNAHVASGQVVYHLLNPDKEFILKTNPVTKEDLLPDRAGQGGQAARAGGNSGEGSRRLDDTGA